jgi:hypothetical protein
VVRVTPAPRRVTNPEVRTLPRAYFVRRRLTPTSTPAVAVEHRVEAAKDQLVDQPAAVTPEHVQAAATEEPISTPESREAFEIIEPAEPSEFSNKAEQFDHTEQVEPVSQADAVGPTEQPEQPEPPHEPDQTNRVTPEEPHPRHLETATVEPPAQRPELAPVVPTPLPQFSARKIVLVVLAVVALMIVVSAAVAVFVERRFSAPISLSLPSSDR